MTTTTTTVSEAQLQAFVTETAQTFGWLTYHTHDSRRSAPGFPDLVLARHGRVVYAELKATTGRLSDAQSTWLAHLEAPDREVYVWRPEDMRNIAGILR